MKKFLFPIFAFVAVMFVTACATRQTAAEREVAAVEIRNAVEVSDFRFVPRSAHPAGFRTVQLMPPFGVDVSPDTVRVDMPFFGRAFRAPMNPTEGGYRFTSTDFEYSVVPGRRAGNWLVQIVFRDLDRRVVFNFDIWEDGSARLSVADVNRQSISFQGDIELKD